MELKDATDADLEKDFVQSFCSKFVVSYCSDFSICPTSLNIRGCCLFADISGFTKMSSELCSSGANGLDKLRHNMNSFFGNMVDIVSQFGTSLIN